jgi:5-methylcytosine-specific restriction endonuclease McrA
MEVRRVTIAGGATQFRQQCLTCGELIGQAISRASVPPNVPPNDDGLAERYRKHRQAEYKSIIQRHVRKQKAHDTEWRAKYETYLQSPEWKAKRDKVLKRADGKCEGCGERPASEVHHLTYAHVCEEFLFELVALCTDCHARVHHGDEAPIENEWRDGYPCDACRWQDEHENRRWCGKFDMRAAQSLAAEGPCGPKHAELEPLK